MKPKKALQKYPNSFEVVYQSALSFYTVRTRESAARALPLFQKACELIEQNTDPQTGVVTIQNQIAVCYAFLGRYGSVVELLKKNNIAGHNNALIGSLLTRRCGKHTEVLKYLSGALKNRIGQLCQISMGYGFPRSSFFFTRYNTSVVKLYIQSIKIK